jgi:hypothetical protein
MMAALWASVEFSGSKQMQELRKVTQEKEISKCAFSRHMKGRSA